MNQACKRAMEAWESCRRRNSNRKRFRPTTFAGVVRAYREYHRRGAKAELDYYANLPSLKEAIVRAGWAERPDGKRHDHQTRLQRRALREVEQTLLRVMPRRFKNFDDLHELLAREIGPISGIGELMVYDTALRIGAQLGLAPQSVYLHRGTRQGARALGIDSARRSVERRELPKEFRTLRPSEIEDCLCIYKNALHAMRSGNRRNNGKQGGDKC